ncbi:hypothetical protein GCM10008959_25530 [Deinococcus seoulensis]|uniref:Uncharacterized protein n=1 Tax=Deinococcus seoulensis TaxID=1837379 RepID=A0ABQ2RSZ2_9DEIO|nr:hypothetical protein [Deinococcus seoulensis]GGR62441.1 hypothetical protein GCM10008959_25530 [Deinococcus seoulensis]
MTPDQTHDLIRYAIFAAIMLGILGAYVATTLRTDRPARRAHTDRRLSPVEYATLEIVRAGLQRHGFDALKPEHVHSARRAALMIAGEARKDPEGPQ